MKRCIFSTVVLSLLMPLSGMTAQPNLCNGTDTINCKIVVPKYSPTRFKEEILFYTYDSSYGYMDSEKNIEEIFKSKAIEKVVASAYKDFESLERNKADYDKVECILDTYKETKRAHVAKEMQFGKIAGSPDPQEGFENVLFHIKVKCTVQNHLPINMAEVKAHQCLEAQRCLSEVTTITELKRAETFRDKMCGSTDSVHVAGDSARKAKATNSPPASALKSNNSSR